MTDIFVELPAGVIRGIADHGIACYLGVPYAAPPEGSLRFAKPVPAPRWDGVRDATTGGALAPQSPPMKFPTIDVAALFGPAWAPGSADYLTLNIWRPDDDRAGLPVMVFIHGGGFISGSKDIPACNGRAFARDGIVCIAINYRLGVEGFLPIPGMPTNLGLRDQIAALQWVQDNVGLFGGDAANVTVFGESAGAFSIGCLLASPLANGLFRRAILQSGHGIIRRDIPVARRAVAKLAKLLKISPDAAGFRAIGHEAMLHGQDRLAHPLRRLDLRDAGGVDLSFGISRFSPVLGDDVVPESPELALAKGASADVALLIGSNAEEMNMFTIASGIRDKIWAPLAIYVMHKYFPNARKLLKAYGLGRRGISPGVALTEAATDMVFRVPARAFAAAHRGPTHFYEFEWRSPMMGGELGAAHALEMPFVFDTLPLVASDRGLWGENPPQELADRMHGLWASFAKGEAPPWPEFSAGDRQVYLLEKGAVIREQEAPGDAFM